LYGYIKFEVEGKVESHSFWLNGIWIKKKVMIQLHSSRKEVIFELHSVSKSLNKNVMHERVKHFKNTNFPSHLQA